MNVDLVRLAGSRGRLSDAPTVDPVTAEVIRGGMETVCFEMAKYVSRTATTPILNQSNERNATVLDAQGRLAALSVGIPQFMLTSTLPVRFALEFLGVDEFREGDVFVANDPYHGGGHLPDYNVFAPVFADDPTRRRAAHGADREHPVPPRRHRRRRARRLQHHRDRHLGRGRALAGREGHRPRRRAPRRAVRAAGQQPHPELHRRPARADRRRAARRAHGSARSSTATARRRSRRASTR